MRELDIIIPVFNSSSVLPDLIKRLNEFAQNEIKDVRVVFVDDSSIDGSAKVIEEQKKMFEYKIIQLARNYGQHTATAVGLGEANAKLVATIDDDLQHDPFEIVKLMEQLKNQHSDLVFGSYLQKKHSIFRNIGSWLLKKIFLLDGIDYSGVTSFRLMKLHVAGVFKEIKYPIVFIEEYLVKSSSKTSICKIQHLPRLSGKSSYSGLKLFRFALKIILFHSAVPLKFIIRFGLFMAVSFFLCGCYYIYNKIVNDVQLGFTSIIVAIFFSAGLILFSIGIIGEYIRKIWSSRNNIEQIIILEKH